jgi:hypothetical protein
MATRERPELAPGGTVTMAADEILTAVATLDAAGSLLTALLGGQETEPALYFSRAAWRLADHAFDSGEERWNPDDPVVVEADARSDELVADLLEPLGKAAARYRSAARRKREAGSAEVPFHEGEGDA